MHIVHLLKTDFSSLINSPHPLNNREISIIDRFFDLTAHGRTTNTHTHTLTSDMSFTQVGFSTQIGPFPHPSQRPNGTQIILVHTDRMNHLHTRLMEDAKFLLLEFTHIAIVSMAEIVNLSPKVHLFVIPFLREDLVKRIRNHVDEKPRILTARAVIEALKYRQVQLPTRSLAISLSMVNCRIFLVKSLNTESLRRKINEMCGTCVPNFNDPNLNVVITDKADNRYCAKARKRNIAVVSMEWVEETYCISKSEEDKLINYDALSSVPDHQIKPFLGLRFKINIPELSRPLRTLISDNLGKVAYGNAEITHIVETNYPDLDKDNTEPRVVDVEFLETCVSMGHYMTPKEYHSHITGGGMVVKQEMLSQASNVNPNNCFTPPIPNARSTLSSIKSNGYENRLSENFSMPPPASSVSRQALQRKSHIQDIILESLDNLSGPQQTQMPSTQICRLPENEIQIERTCEPSQQLYWNDNCTRRH